MENDLISLFGNKNALSRFFDTDLAKDMKFMTSDIYETDDAFVIHGDLPGVPKENVSVEVNGDTLVVSAHYDKETKKGDSKKTLMCERHSGSYVRRFQLPGEGGYDKDNITAKLENGVLTVTVPKIEVKKETNKIEVK